MEIKAKENGKVVSDLRKKNFLRSNEMCKAAGISEPTLRNVENGKVVSKITAQKIADYFVKKIEDLFEVK